MRMCSYSLLMDGVLSVEWDFSSFRLDVRVSSLTIKHRFGVTSIECGIQVQVLCKYEVSLLSVSSWVAKYLSTLFVHMVHH